MVDPVQVGQGSRLGAAAGPRSAGGAVGVPWLLWVLAVAVEVGCGGRQREGRGR